jgi:hypothetical protein
MSREDKVQEIKELEILKRNSEFQIKAIQSRINWLMDNLDTPQSKEEATMEDEYNTYIGSKTQSFTL